MFGLFFLSVFMFFEGF